MKKDYDIILATQIRGKWWRVDYINKTGIMERNPHGYQHAKNTILRLVLFFFEAH